MNTGEDEWEIERFEVVGFGRRFGSSPFGGRASGWHLGSVPYAVAAPATALWKSWAATVLSGAVWEDATDSGSWAASPLAPASWPTAAGGSAGSWQADSQVKAWSPNAEAPASWQAPQAPAAGSWATATDSGSWSSDSVAPGSWAPVP